MNRKKNYTNKKKQINKAGKGSRYAQDWARRKREMQTISFLSHRIVPRRIYTKLVYTTPVTLNNTLGNSASKSYVPVGLYDIDPSVGSAAIPGFVELMTLYQAYRVVKVKAKVVFMNNDTQPYEVALAFHVNGTRSANAYGLALYGNDFVTHKSISGKGGNDRVTLVREQYVPEVYGNADEYYAGSTFIGTNASNPTDTGLQMFVAAVGINTMTNGLVVMVEITCWAEFFNCALQSS